MLRAEKTMKVGGQAVMEGVMMRSPNSLAVAVRRQGGEIIIKEAAWRPILGSFGVFKWPFIRGSVVLLESLVNGISALNFSARVAMEDLEQETKDTITAEPTSEKSHQKTTPPDNNLDGSEEKVSDWMIWSTVAFALALGIGLFVALPHLAVWLGSKMLGRELGVDEFLFHLVTGCVKLLVFVGYIALISRMEDIRRVFMYHGAEHQSIYAYEAGQPLTVASARQHKPMHPRCGTTFLIMVIGISILVFALVFPFLIWLIGEPTGIRWLDHILYIFIKLPLLFPIAGLAYEFQKLTSRFLHQWWAKALAWPGMFIQRLTTRPPTDDQLEVALASLYKTLWREKIGQSAAQATKTYKDFDSLVRELESG